MSHPRTDRVRKLGLLLAWSAAIVRPDHGRALDVSEALARERRRDRLRTEDER